MESAGSITPRPAGKPIQVHDDGELVRRSVTIRRPLHEVRSAWSRAGIFGEVTFAAAPGDMGTEVHVIAPRTEQSAFREIFGSLLHDDPGESLSTQLRRFRAQLETGEVPTTDGQPSGREAKSS